MACILALFSNMMVERFCPGWVWSFWSSCSHKWDHLNLSISGVAPSIESISRKFIIQILHPSLSIDGVVSSIRHCSGTVAFSVIFAFKFQHQNFGHDDCLKSPLLSVQYWADQQGTCCQHWIHLPIIHHLNITSQSLKSPLLSTQHWAN